MTAKPKKTELIRLIQTLKLTEDRYRVFQKIGLTKYQKTKWEWNERYLKLLKHDTLFNIFQELSKPLPEKSV